MLLFWESGGEGQKLGTDFGFKSQQRYFGEIRKFVVKSEGRFAVQTGKDKKMARSYFSECDKNIDDGRKPLGK